MGRTTSLLKLIINLPKRDLQLLYGAAPLVFSFPSELPATGSYRRLTGIVICVFVGLTCAITMGCLSSVLQFKWVTTTTKPNWVYSRIQIVFPTVRRKISLPYRLCSYWRKWISIIWSRLRLACWCWLVRVRFLNCSRKCTIYWSH